MHKRLFCLLAALLCLAGCSAKGEPLAAPCPCGTPEDRIFAAVAALYTLPDKYHTDNKAVWAGTDSFTLRDSELEAWQAHDRGRFHEGDFAPGLWEELTTLSPSFASKTLMALGILGPRYSRYGVNGDFPVGLERMLAEGTALSCSSVASEARDDGSWGITATVVFTGPEGGETRFTITGTAQFDADGRFTSIQMADDGGLSEYLEDEWLWPGSDAPSYPYGHTPGPSASPAP